MNQNKNLDSYSSLSDDYPSPLWNIAIYNIKGHDWKNKKERTMIHGYENEESDNEENDIVSSNGDSKEHENTMSKKELIEFYTDEIFTNEFQDDIHELHENVKNILKESLGCVYDKDSYCDFFNFVKHNSTLYYQIKRELNEKSKPNKWH